MTANMQKSISTSAMLRARYKEQFHVSHVTSTVLPRQLGSRRLGDVEMPFARRSWDCIGA
eukprot:7297392-Alexandrium_andersonii.AAC.1